MVNIEASIVVKEDLLQQSAVSPSDIYCCAVVSYVVVPLVFVGEGSDETGRWAADSPHPRNRGNRSRNTNDSDVGEIFHDESTQTDYWVDIFLSTVQHPH